MQRRLMLGAGVLAVSGAASRAADAPARITIDNFSFTPAVLTVAAGTTVTWVNRDDIPHSVVSQEDARRMKSPALDTDESFSFTFEAPGTYGYFCSLHPHMQGTVVVR